MSEEWQPAEHGTDNRGLQQRVARGIFWAIADNWGRQLVGLLVFFVLVALLTPVDFGLVALATVFVAFAQIFVDQGMGDALVQRRQVTPEHIDTAFWVSLLTGVLLTVAGIVLAIPIAALMGEPELRPILQVLSFIFVLTALSSVQIGLLRREMAFRSLALRALFGIVGGGLVGIAMAFMGSGAWALVGQQLTTAALSTLTLWRVSPWRPSRRLSAEHFRELFSFGINVVGTDFLNFLSRYMDNLLIGIVLGTGPLGIYSVGYRILEATGAVLVGIARKVAFPAFARLQHDRERMKRAFFRVSRASGLIIIPGYVGLALVAPELIAAMFGGVWLESGPVAAVLFMIGPVLGIQSFSSGLLYAAGHPEVVFRFRLVTTVTNVVGFAVAVQYGILAVAAAFVLRGYLLMPLNLYWVSKYAGVRTREYLAQLAGIATSTVAMAAAVLLVKFTLLGRTSDELLLAAEIASGAVVFVAVVLVIERSLVREIRDVTRQVVAGRRPGGGRGNGRRRRLQQVDPAMAAVRDDDV